MTTEISLSLDDIKHRRQIRVDLNDGKVMFIFTGNAIVNFKNVGVNLIKITRATIKINEPIPGLKVNKEVFVVDQEAVFAAPTSIQADQPKESSVVWAVDDFWLQYRTPQKRVTKFLPLMVNLGVGVLGAESTIWRFAYHITVVGHYDQFRSEDETRPGG
jgi:hypothetical protein